MNHKKNGTATEKEIEKVPDEFTFGESDLHFLESLSKDEIYKWFEKFPQEMSEEVIVQMALIFKRATDCNLSPKDKDFWDMEKVKKHWKSYAVTWDGLNSFVSFLHSFTEVWKFEKKFFYKENTKTAANAKEATREKLREKGINPDQSFIHLTACPPERILPLMKKLGYDLIAEGKPDIPEGGKK